MPVMMKDSVWITQLLLNKSNSVAIKPIHISQVRHGGRWWREVLSEDFQWAPSPVTREAKSAFTEGQPDKYPDDDIFGYMAAKKAAKKTKAKDAKKDDSAQVALDIDTAEEVAAGEESEKAELPTRVAHNDGPVR
jgi:CRISPR-associated protein Cst2